jgi:hypothetical protein
MRTLAAVAGILAATFAVLMVISSFQDSTFWHRYLANSLIKTGVCIVSAYLFLRYAVAGSLRSEMKSPLKAAVDRIFKSLGVGTAALIIFSMVLPLGFMAVAAVWFRNLPDGAFWDRLGRVLTNVQDSAAFWIALLVVFLLAFYWEYRREARRTKRASA